MTATVWTLLVVALAALTLYVLFIVMLYLAGKRNAARAISGFVPDCLILFKRLLQDRQVATRYKVVLVLLIGYLASPIDLVPDFIPIVGQLDDAIIVALALRLVLGGAGRSLAEQHWPGPHSSLAVLLKLAGIR